MDLIKFWKTGSKGHCYFLLHVDWRTHVCSLPFDVWLKLLSQGDDKGSGHVEVFSPLGVQHDTTGEVALAAARSTWSDPKLCAGCSPRWIKEHVAHSFQFIHVTRCSGGGGGGEDSSFGNTMS